MEKLKMHSVDGVARNIDRIGELFPNAVTEVLRDGKVERAVDFDVLRQELSDVIVEGREERYQFTWPGKNEAKLRANLPISAALRPVEAESVGRDGTPGGFDSENLYIEGDNLEVLKLLRETYLGKVKMIYIDPPYNTGGDFIYNDKFAAEKGEYMANSGQFDEEGNRMEKNLESKGRFHSDWCSMIYPRLKVAKDLLADDGVIFMSIDENEVGNLRKLATEIFGESNFAGEIIWKNSSKNDQAYISIQHEYILCYVKNKLYNIGEWKEAKEGVDEIFKAFDNFRAQYGDDWNAIHKAALEWYKQFPESNPIYDSKHYSWMDDKKGVYFPDNISGPHYGQYRYDVIHPVTGKVCKEPASGWRFPESKMKERIAQGLIHFGADETTVPNNKTYLKDTLNQSLTSVKYRDGRVASKRLTELMGKNYFTNPKDVDLLARIFYAVGLKDGDIILDFFAGSGTTAEAAIQIAARQGVKARFIVVQIREDLDKSLIKATGSSKQVLLNDIELCDELGKPHYLTEIGKERIRRAGKKIKEESPLTTQDLDVGFRCLRLDTSNMKDVYYRPDELRQEDLFAAVDNVKEGRGPEDLLFQAMLELGAELSAKIETAEIAGKKVFNVADNYLLACFDTEVTDETVAAMAKMKPQYAVLRDNSMESDSVAVNFEQIFKTYSPDTKLRVL